MALLAWRKAAAVGVPGERRVRAAHTVLAAIILVVIATGGPARAAQDLWGVIEIGASGVRVSQLQLTREQALAIEDQFGEDKANFKYELVDKDLAASEKARDTNIRKRENVAATRRAAEELRDILQQKYAVPIENIFVFASSSVADLSHAEELRRGLEEIFKPDQIAFLNAFQECALSYHWIVPRNRFKEAVVIDIGSGNTKACYVEDPWSREPQMQSFELLELGTKTLADKVDGLMRAKQAPTSFLQESEAFRRAYLEKALAAKISSYPGLANARRFYLVGGIVYAATIFVRPRQFGEDWIAISPNDWKTLRNRIKAGRTYDVDLAQLRDQPARRDKAEKEVHRIMTSVFTPDQMTAGIDLLLALDGVLDLPEQRTERRAMFFSSRAFEGMRYQYLLDRITGR